MRLECPVEIGEVLEPAAGSDAQHRVIRCVQGFGSGIEPVFLEKSNEALPGHLPEPPHKMALAARHQLCCIGDMHLFAIMVRHPLQNLFQPPGVGGLHRRQVLPLCNEQRQKAQQCPFDKQLIARLLGAVHILGLPQAGGGTSITWLVRGHALGQRQPPTLQRQQVFFGTEVSRAAQQFQIKDDVLIFHGTALLLPQGMECPRRKDKDIPCMRRIGRCAHLHKAAAALDKDQLHAVLPVQCHLREVPRDGAGIDVEWKTHGTVLLCFLQKRWISHVCFLLMIGLYHNLHCLGKILHVLCGIS